MTPAFAWPVDLSPTDSRTSHPADFRTDSAGPAPLAPCLAAFTLWTRLLHPSYGRGTMPLDLWLPSGAIRTSSRATRASTGAQIHLPAPLISSQFFQIELIRYPPFFVIFRSCFFNLVGISQDPPRSGFFHTSSRLRIIGSASFSRSFPTETRRDTMGSTSEISEAWLLHQIIHYRSPTCSTKDLDAMRHSPLRRLLLSFGSPHSYFPMGCFGRRFSTVGLVWSVEASEAQHMGQGRCDTPEHDDGSCSHVWGVGVSLAFFRLFTCEAACCGAD